MAKKLTVIFGVLFFLIGIAGVGSGAEVEDSVVTEVRIDDDGVKVGSKRIGVNEGLRERRYEIIGEDVVRFADDVIIEESEVVEGDAVAIFGSIIVDGVIEGDVVAVAGGISVGPNGQIDGDAVALGGGISKAPGGVIRGETVSLGRGSRFRPRPFGPVFTGGLFSRSGRLFVFIMWTILLVVLAIVITVVARRPVERVCERARREAFKVGLIGLLAEVLLVPLMVLFMITIIGIPIGAIVLPLVFALAMLLGYVGVSLAIGERFANGRGRSLYTSVAIGILLLQALAILGGVVRLPGGSIGVVGTIIAIIGWAVMYVAATVGLGAVIVSKFGTSGMKAQKVEVEAPQQM